MSKIVFISADTPNTTEMEYTMPCCGLTIRHCRTDNNGDNWEIRNIVALHYWADSRATRHRCDMVNDSNPMGQIPRRCQKAPGNVTSATH